MVLQLLPFTPNVMEKLIHSPLLSQIIIRDLEDLHHLLGINHLVTNLMIFMHLSLV